jgi:FKBP-type peptidyl-prolyl cis-trans isomerase FklB
MKTINIEILRQACAVCAWVALSSAAMAQTPSGSPAVAPGADPAPAPNTEESSYVYGLLLGTQMRDLGITNEVTPETLMRGMKDGLNGKAPTSTQEQQLQAFVHSILLTGIARNEAAAKSFLAHNAHEKGVITTASGLQYKILSAGDKKAPPIKLTDTVTADYRGKLIDGSEFDSSYSRGVPTPFQVDGVIKGWQEALVLMKPGAKWEVFVPPALAYGDNPRPKIPGGSLLIFEINLLSDDTAAGPAAPPGTPRPHN